MKVHLKRIGFWTASLLALLMLALVAPASAGDDDRSGTFLTSFPDNDVYQVTVFGDAFADGLLGGLIQAFNADVRLNIQRQVSPIWSVAGSGFEAKVAALEKAIGAQPFNIAIVMVGENDRISIRGADGKRIAMGSDQWIAEYTRRIDRLMRAFKRQSTGVYWVGLPTLARGDNELVQRMNDVMRERAYLNGYKYIDTFQGFSGDNGGYSAYGPDLEGAIRLLRLRDGVNFTDVGNRKLAHFVEKDLRSDLMQAKANRNIPLLGAEPEQAKINPGNTVKTPAPSSPVASGKQEGGKAPVVRGLSLDGTPPSSTSTASGDQKSDNGKIVLKVAGSNGREETHDRNSAARNPGIRRGADGPPRGLGPARRSSGRSDSRRIDVDEFDHAIGRQRSRQAFADAGALLPAARQGRAPAAEARPRRRRDVAAEKQHYERGKARRAAARLSGHDVRADR